MSQMRDGANERVSFLLAESIFLYFVTFFLYSRFIESFPNGNRAEKENVEEEEEEQGAA
ncbi:hypothetical protein GWI33_005730, partial [Rhynchophorus ferrugineus]